MSDIEIVNQIIDESARIFGIGRKDILGEERPDHIIKARHAAMWAARETTNLSLKTIGQIFGRNHATVMNAVACADIRGSQDRKYLSTLNSLRLKSSDDVPS